MHDAQHENYEFGEFRLETGKRQLLRRGQPVPLTPKAFETLLHLLRKRDVVVEKDELMQALWPDTSVEENNLNQNISALRRVLGQSDGGDRYILTVPGRGYRFAAEVTTDGHAEAPTSPRSIAVLPFRPLVAEERDEALEMGMADTLIARLGGNHRTVVPSLSSVRRYTAMDRDPVAAARELGVQFVLDGSLHLRGNRMRVTVRLVGVADGASLWTQTFNEEFTDVFAVQDTIAKKVAAALALRLSPEERRELTRRYTENVEAYRLFVKGWYHLGKATPLTIGKGIELFQQAIDLDPCYALAYAGLAEAYRRLPITSDVPPKEAFPKAKAAATQALNLDASLAEAHMSLGFTKFWFDWDWAGAEGEFKRAIELNPAHAETRMSYAVMLTGLRRYDDAIEQGRTSIELDPLSLIVNANFGWVLYCSGQNKLARTQLEKALEIEPRFWVAQLHLARIEIEEGAYPAAISALENSRQASGGNSETIALLGYAYALSVRQPEAQRVLEDLLTQAKARYIPPHNIALIYNGLGDGEQAMLWLEKAYQDRDVRLAFLNTNPKWNSYRDDPRFKNLLRRIGLE
jgi:serine/threonine-protein kinase